MKIRTQHRRMRTGYRFAVGIRFVTLHTSRAEPETVKEFLPEHKGIRVLDALQAAVQVLRFFSSLVVNLGQA
jgi:hypothetical protein